MKILVMALFLFASAVKLAPVLGFFVPSQISTAYGVAVEDSNLAILLRHRAALFAIVGGLLAAAAFRPSLRPLAAAIGLYSMLSYSLVVRLNGPANAQLQLYAGVDLFAAAVLIAALALNHRLRANEAGS